MTWFALYLLNIALHVADGVLTVKILSNGGKELNPAMSYLMDELGAATALIFAKGCFLLMLFAWADEMVLAIVAVPYFFIVGYNWWQLRR